MCENVSILAEWMRVLVRAITRVIRCLIYVRMKHSGGAGATGGRGRLSLKGVFVFFFFALCAAASKMDSARQEE